ncbi:rRNA adenine methyltransferase [Mucilaginibacter conchicola]|uniref:rRNA adenine methyltransferase n=1 Tax=Mucilaginibacter conchicola TaxID=2303333 RepID=A0A372NR42_9SPHI|nr:rRNA adenine methyltransferase [Mucilaginibacter conchicola]RFZ90733.1 rRNA adenine methyltransferase [Mucilaginibacter conchicola]
MFDSENPVNKLCAEGMMLEGEAKSQEALKCFTRAWDIAQNDFERFTAAHYVARHQADVSGKLHWDKTALDLALSIDTSEVKALYPSLYLNVAKCHEDMGDFKLAFENYSTAKQYTAFLPQDGYGDMIKKGVDAGITRVRGNEF